MRLLWSVQWALLSTTGLGLSLISGGLRSQWAFCKKEWDPGAKQSDIVSGLFENIWQVTSLSLSCFICKMVIQLYLLPPGVIRTEEN